MAINATPFTTGAVLTAAQMTNLPMGYLDGVTGTATTSITGGTALSVLSKSITIYASRKYRISGYLGFQPSANSTGNAVYFVETGGISKVLWYRGDQIPANYPQYVGGSYVTDATALGVTSGTSSKTFTMYVRTGGNGALNTNPDGLVGANSAEQIFWIEDIGAM
jgi:hypothetical protein